MIDNGICSVVIYHFWEAWTSHPACLRLEVETGIDFAVVVKWEILMFSALLFVGHICGEKPTFLHKSIILIDIRTCLYHKAL